MQRIASKMKLLPGYEAEYRKRHDAIWPELKTLLVARGISAYSIFLDPETLTLFAVLQAEDPSVLDSLPAEKIMQRWWAYMKDIMETNPDNSPVAVPLTEVFYLSTS